jgi:hypothetical protein
MISKICKSCGQPFEPYHPSCRYCSDECRPRYLHATASPPPTKICKGCGQPFEPDHASCRYCSHECGPYGPPAVYRFISPDGRSYVGSTRYSHERASGGIHRSNPRLLAAFQIYRPETFVFEILERLPLRCSEWKLRKAEQRHINRLRSWKPEAGFNMNPAVWQGDGPSQRAGRELSAAKASHMRRARQWLPALPARKATE